MTGYFYLAIALFAGIAKGFSGKSISRGVKNLNDGIFINIIRMLFCTVIGFFVTLIKTDISSLMCISLSSVPIFLMSAVSMSLFCVCWMYAYRNESYVFLNIFTMSGTIVTCILGYIVYREPIGLNKWLGMAILLLSVYIMSLYNKKISGKITFADLMILIVGALGSATADFSQKVYARQTAGEASVFNFYTYAISLILLFVVYLFVKKPEPHESAKELKSPKYILTCFAMSAFLYINTITKTIAASYLTTAQIYPVLQGANLILSAIFAQILLKEKINLKSIAGMALAFTGLIVMNVL